MNRKEIIGGKQNDVHFNISRTAGKEKPLVQHF